MFPLIAISGVLVLLAGAAVKVFLDRTGGTERITRNEYVIGSTLCLLVILPAVTGIGVHLAKQSKVTFHEYWNGVETNAVVDPTTCTRDGSCRHTYDCDPYQVTEHYTVQVPYTTTESYTNANGQSSTRTVTRYRTESRTRQVTKYHACPYVDTEYSYIVDTTLGEKVIASHWFPENPEQHKWRPFTSLPNVPSGVPAEWEAAKARIAAGEPAGVTEQHDYDNFILASQTTILHRFSEAIAGYKEKGLLPDTARPSGNMAADKVHFVGPVPAGTSADDWQSTLGRLNGAFGGQLQGDLHLVVVTSPEVTDPDEYSQALLAHWQSPEMGKDALSKNGLLVVVGSTDGGNTTAWARAYTGMPIGNEDLLVQLTGDLEGVAMTPAALVGAPTVTNPGSAEPAFAHSDGKLEQALWGPNAFERVCMTCGDAGEDGQVGYSYLMSQIEPSTGAKVWIVIIGFVLCLGAWVGFAAYTSPHAGRSGDSGSGGLGSGSRYRRRPFAAALDPDLARRVDKITGRTFRGR